MPDSVALTNEDLLNLAGHVARIVQDKTETEIQAVTVLEIAQKLVAVERATVWKSQLDSR